MPQGPAFYVYEDRAREWRWTLVAGNSRTVADSSEGYRTRADCIAAMNRVRQYVNDSSLHIHNEKPPGY
jgi:uncharacterized protein YegP (UPF0339 family)